VLADALTSVLAIFALGSGRWLGAVWMDPVMGMVGAALVTRWSVGLLRDTGAVLLDRQAPEAVREAVRRAIEDGTGDVVVDLHVWTIGPGIRACALAVDSAAGSTPEEIRARLPRGLGIVHATVEATPKS
jgi:Co/Zn/Cd efflux system component